MKVKYKRRIRGGKKSRIGWGAKGGGQEWGWKRGCVLPPWLGDKSRVLKAASKCLHSPPPPPQTHVKNITSKCHIHIWSHFSTLKPPRIFFTPILISCPILTPFPKTLASSGFREASKKGFALPIPVQLWGNVLPLDQDWIWCLLNLIFFTSF